MSDPITERAGTLSLSEQHYLQTRVPAAGRDYGDAPDADFDPIAHHAKVDAALTDYVMDLPAENLLEFISEMSEADKVELRATLRAHRLHTGGASDLGNFIDRMFDKWNREVVENSIND